MDSSPRLGLPLDHPLRQRLNDEVHARPPERIAAPARVSFVALLADEAQRAQSWRVIAEIAAAAGATPPAAEALHFSAAVGGYRLKAERHTEFLRVKIIVPGFGRGSEADPFAETALETSGATWLSRLQGETISAVHAAILPARSWPPDSQALADSGDWRNSLIGALISDGRGAAFSDLFIRDDGFSRLLIFDNGLTTGQIGRNLQRLVEVEAYRMLALLAFPIARARMGELTALESELRDAASALISAEEAEEPRLLERLTHLAATMESLQAVSQFRFGAANSYYALLLRRLAELREERLGGLLTFSEFFDRRLAPAMRTCRVVVERQETLSARISRATELLSTRVELSSQRQSHALLELDGPPRTVAASPAGDRRGAVGGGDHLLHRLAGREGRGGL